MKQDTIDKSLNFALEASAGTGKTYQLSMRVAAMLLNGVPIHDILCLTFTNKANDEAMERVVTTLSKLAAGKADTNQTGPLINLMARNSKDKKYEYTEQELQKDAKVARDNMLEEFSSLKIKTIDSFYNSILKLFPFEAQLRPDYAICTEEENKKLLEEAFFTVVETLLEDKDWKKVFSGFSQIMEQNKSQSLEILQKYAEYTAPKRIELQLPVKKAPLSPDKILSAMERADIERHKIFNLVEKFVETLNRKTPNKQQISSIDKLAKCKKIKELVKEKLLSDEEPSVHSYFKKMTFTPDELNLHKEIKETISKYLSLKGDIAKAVALVLGGGLFLELRTLKNEKNVLTYTDIGERVYDVLVTDKNNIDKEYLYFRLDAKINHILIDEFQDTSVPQWLMLRPLAEEAMAGTGQYDKNGSFFYVGDPKQNLYRFRGGSSELFEKVATTYPDKLLRETLDTNYRSGKNIVETVNIVFKKAADIIYGKTSRNMFQLDQKTPPEKEDGYVFIDRTPDDKNIDFSDFCLEHVQKCYNAGFSYGEIAILVPTNKDGAKIADKLITMDIPVRLETSDKLAQSNVFRAIMGLVAFIETGEDFSFLEFALTGTPAFDISKYADKIEKEKIKHHILKIAKQHDRKPIFEKIIAIIKETGMQNRFVKEPDFFQTLDIMASCAGCETNTDKFIQNVSKKSYDKAALTSGESKAVAVMTVHKSKGLQFPCVILPKLNYKLKTNAKESTFILTEKEPGKISFEYVHTIHCKPFLKQKENEALDAENSLVTQDSLNKLYVAMTRAQEALIIRAGQSDVKKITQDKEIDDFLNDCISTPYEKGHLKPYGQKPSQQTGDYSVAAECRILDEKTPIEKESSGDYKSAAFGTALHTGAFLLNGFQAEDVEKAYFGAIAANGAMLDDKEKSEIKNYLQLLATNNHWQQLFQGQVFRERKVGFAGALYSIDFYAEMSDKIVLIEYKTGEITNEIYEKYKSQLNLYTKILKNIYDKPIEKIIYHFHNGELDIKNVNYRDEIL